MQAIKLKVPKIHTVVPRLTILITRFEHFVILNNIMS